MNDSVDIIFCSLPYSEIELPYSAPAILKAIVKAEGYTAKTKDFGMVLFDLCGRDAILMGKLQHYFISPTNPLTESEQKIKDKFYDEIISYFKENPSKFIGISVFTLLTHKCTYEITQRIREEKIPGKIVIGGRGAKSLPYSVMKETMNLNFFEKSTYYGYVLQQRKLVDHVVIGDGEDAILDVLSGNKEIKENYSAETFEYPIPDYSDYELTSYHWKNDTISFPITGSRGCVRDCDFCDIRHHFGKYKYRKGKDIAEEMLKIHKQYGFTKFNFTDSLVNGGLKPLEEFCSIIADYNNNNPENKLSWTGQYVCREAKFMPERLYRLMAESGAEGLTIGAESGSDHVLEHMDKKTTATALLEELEMFRKYGITSFLLILIGHWGEREEDFVEHCRVMAKLLPFIRSGTISMISLGVPAMVLDGTPAIKEVDEGKIVRADFDKEFVWLAKYNPTNTLKERMWRRLIISRLSDALQYPLDREVIQLSEINNTLSKNHKEINEFFRETLAQL